MKDRIFGILQRIGRSFMLPIAILPAAGLLLGIGSSFTNAHTISAYGLKGLLGEGTILHGILLVMKDAGDIVFSNLPIIFAVGVAIGMAKQEKEVAALSAAIAFFIMHASISALLEANGSIVDGQPAQHVLSGTITSVVGIQSLQMGVFGGIIVGLGVAALHNRFYKIQLPQALSFFGGTRFVPIISALTYVFVGVLMVFIWPWVQRGIFSLGDLVRSSGYAGTWVYGLIERALIPFGLHHVFYIPFWQTAVGGTMEIGGTLYEGAQNIYFAQLADPQTTSFSVEATRFLAGKFPFMIFGLPGAALAMYQCAKKENKKAVGGLLLSAALTSILTGITEPLEFTFLFVAPVLYIVHCVFAGFSFMLMHLFGVGVGMTFSGGFIDLLLFGILQGNAKTNWIWILIVGIAYFALYYLVFQFLIRKLRLKTPGREEGGEGEIKLYTRADVDAARKQKEGSPAGGRRKEAEDTQCAMIVAGLGGKGNIADLDCCITRLRITVVDSTKVREDILRQTGAAGIIKKGAAVQLVYGPKVTVIRSDLEAYLADPKKDGITLASPENRHAAEAVEERNQKENARAGSNTGSDGRQGFQEAVYAPVRGKAVALYEIGDDVFSEGMVGQGMAIEPESGQVFAPFDGHVSMVFDTKHAMGLVSDRGVELLIHIGIDTVELKGKHFEILVRDGDRFKKGDLLARFDLQGLKKDGYRTVTPVVVTNSDEYGMVETAAQGQVDEKKKLLVVR